MDQAEDWTAGLAQLVACSYFSSALRLMLYLMWEGDATRLTFVSDRQKCATFSSSLTRFLILGTNWLGFHNLLELCVRMHLWLIMICSVCTVLIGDVSWLDHWLWWGGDSRAFLGGSAASSGSLHRRFPCRAVLWQHSMLSLWPSYGNGYENGATYTFGAISRQGTLGCGRGSWKTAYINTERTKQIVNTLLLHWQALVHFSASA